jgi:hypothetical protein
MPLRTRDYHTKNPVHCEHYTDALVVKNPGRIRQQNVDLPNRFNLGTTTLETMPPNRKLLEWLRLMKDPEGNAFVQALSEGTKRMTREMVALGLPPPSVVLLENETILKLESKAEERKAAFLASIQVSKTAFMNVYPLAVTKGSGPATGDEIHLRLGECSKPLRDSLAAHGWYIDRFSFSRIVAHRTGADLPIPQAAHKVVRFYPAYCIQIHEFFRRPYLAVDYTCQVLNVLKAHEVGRHIGSEDLIGRSCVAQTESWRTGRIVTADAEWGTVHFFDNEEENKVQVNRVIPNLSLAQIETILHAQGVSFDLYGSIKKNSLASEPAAARKRAERIQTTADQLANDIFPVVFGEFEARLVAKAVALSEFEPRSDSTFHVERLSEPAVEFRDHQKLPNVWEGITKFGSYDSDPHAIELVPLCLAKHRPEMEKLIERLKAGKMKYRGAERTFATTFSYSTVVTTDALEGLDREVERILSEHPEWSGNEKLNRWSIHPRQDSPRMTRHRRISW